MTSWILKTMAKRLMGEDLNKPPGKINSDADSLDRKGRKVPKGNLQKREIPQGISDHDKAILKKVRRRAHRLDEGFRICGLKFGVSAIVGLVPVIGDYFDFVMASMVFRTCLQVDGGLDDKVKAKMWSNIIIDAVLGLVPFLGDFADVFFRANSKNAILLEEILAKRGEKNMIPLNATHQSSGHHTVNIQPDPRSDMRYPNSDDRHNHDSIHRHDDQNQVRNDNSTVPSTKTTKGKSSGGGGWLSRFGSSRNNADADLESGMTMPAQPPKARV